MTKLIQESSIHNIFNKERLVYYFFTGISVLLRPLTLLILVNFNNALANQFSVFLIAIQFVLYSIGTQIHKKFLDPKTNTFIENKLYYASFIEGVLLSFAIFFLNIFVFKDLWLCIFLFFQLPIEKLIDDKQRILSYQKKIISMSIFLFMRALIPCLVFLLYLYSEPTNLIYMFIFFGSLLILFISRVFPIKFENLFQNISIRLKSIFKDAKWGIIWSFFSGIAISIDKIILNYLDFQIAEYIFRFQVIQIFLISYTVFFFIPNRHLVLENSKNFLRKIFFPVTIISILLPIFGILFEYVSSLITFIPNMGFSLALLQATILSLYIITHPLTEVIFWTKELKTIASIEACIFLFFIIILITIYSFFPTILGVLISINLYLLIRFFTILKCVY